MGHPAYDLWSLTTGVGTSNMMAETANSNSYHLVLGVDLVDSGLWLLAIREATTDEQVLVDSSIMQMQRLRSSMCGCLQWWYLK